MSRMPLETEIFSEFERGEVPTDRHFDLLLSPEFRSHSRLHWTPVSIATTIARILAPSPEYRVLDVGSGCGKFVCIGALATPGRFYGIENQKNLHQAATALTNRLKLDRTSFAHGDALAADWSTYTGIYLFNPMGAIKQPESYQIFAKAVSEKLSDLASGTQVATYHGFGASFPESFVQIDRIETSKGPIEIWRKE